MTTTSLLHLVISKPQNKSLNLTFSPSKISFFTHKSSFKPLLLPSISFSSSQTRIFSSSSSFPTTFSEANKEEDPFESRRLYVGNLSFSTTSSELSEIFSQAGKVDEVEIIYGRTTNRSRGFAFVTMKTVEEAKEAILMFDGAQIGGRTVKVNLPEVPKGGEREVMGPKLRANSLGYVNSPHKIYVGNLGWKVTSETLRDAFSASAGVLGAKVIYDRDSGRSRGFGFVSFVSATECQAALEAMNGKMVVGRPLRLNLASDKSLSSAPLLATVAASSESHGEETSVDQESSLESNLV